MPSGRRCQKVNHWGVERCSWRQPEAWYLLQSSSVPLRCALHTKPGIGSIWGARERRAATPLLQMQPLCLNQALYQRWLSRGSQPYRQLFLAEHMAHATVIWWQLGKLAKGLLPQMPTDQAGGSAGIAIEPPRFELCVPPESQFDTPDN